MSSIEIIKLRNEHVGRLISFFNKINSPEYVKDFFPHHFNKENARLVCNYEGQDLYFAILLDGEEIIGYCMLRGWDEGYQIPSIGLCVLKKFQGLGIGKIIIKFLETVAILQGCSRVMLKVNRDNFSAIKLYINQGYDCKEFDEEFLIGFKNIAEDELK